MNPDIYIVPVTVANFAELLAEAKTPEDRFGTVFVRRPNNNNWLNVPSHIPSDILKYGADLQPAYLESWRGPTGPYCHVYRTGVEFFSPTNKQEFNAKQIVDRLDGLRDLWSRLCKEDDFAATVAEKKVLVALQFFETLKEVEDLKVGCRTDLYVRERHPDKVSPKGAGIAETQIPILEEALNRYSPEFVDSLGIFDFFVRSRNWLASFADFVDVRTDRTGYVGFKLEPSDVLFAFRENSAATTQWMDEAQVRREYAKAQTARGGIYPNHQLITVHPELEWDYIMYMTAVGDADDINKWSQYERLRKNLGALNPE